MGTAPLGPSLDVIFRDEGGIPGLPGFGLFDLKKNDMVLNMTGVGYPLLQNQNRAMRRL